MVLRLPDALSPFARTAYAPTGYGTALSRPGAQIGAGAARGPNPNASVASFGTGASYQPGGFGDVLARFPTSFSKGFGGFGAPAPAGGSAGAVGRDPTFGQFSKDPGVYNEIAAAAARTGVPANFLQAIIAAESSGDWATNNAKGAMFIGTRNDRILPYIGVFDQTALSRFGESIDRYVGDRGAQIDLLARVLKSQYDEIRRRNPAYDWINVASYHYMGDPNPSNAVADEFGNGTTADYAGKIQRWWQQLDRVAGTTTPPQGTSGQGTGSFDGIWGGGKYPITQEMGLTDFAKGQLNGMYSYATAYGTQGHAGLDVGMDRVNLYTPVAGTVVSAGGTGYYRDDRYGNTPGTGEFRIRLDNGDELILGHMERIAVQPGQRINAGTFVGTSGTANGPHVHVEYRRRTPGATASGFTAVDPRQALGASTFAGFGQAGGGPQTASDLFQSAALGAFDQMSRAGSRTADFARFLWQR